MVNKELAINILGLAGVVLLFFFIIFSCWLCRSISGEWKQHISTVYGCISDVVSYAGVVTRNEPNYIQCCSCGCGLWGKEFFRYKNFAIGIIVLVLILIVASVVACFEDYCYSAHVPAYKIALFAVLSLFNVGSLLLLFPFLNYTKIAEDSDSCFNCLRCLCSCFAEYYTEFHTVGGICFFLGNPIVNIVICALEWNFGGFRWYWAALIALYAVGLVCSIVFASVLYKETTDIKYLPDIPQARDSTVHGNIHTREYAWIYSDVVTKRLTKVSSSTVLEDGSNVRWNSIVVEYITINLIVIANGFSLIAQFASAQTL